MPNRFQWEEGFRRWIARLIPDPGWEWNIVADASLGDCRAEVFSTASNRTATIRFQPNLAARDETCCHEVLHVALSEYQYAAEEIAKQLPEGPARELALSRLSSASEATVKRLAVALIEAFRPLPKERVCSVCGHREVDFQPGEGTPS